VTPYQAAVERVIFHVTIVLMYLCVNSFVLLL